MVRLGGKPSILAACVLSLAVGSGCGDDSDPPLGEGTVAVVVGQAVSAADLAHEANRLRRGGASARGPTLERQALGRLMVERVVAGGQIGSPRAIWKHAVASTECRARFHMIGCADSPPGTRPDYRVNGFVGDRPGSSGGEFREPVAVAAGRDAGTPVLYVVEGHPSQTRIQKLDSNGNFLLAWGWDVVRGGRPGDTGNGHEVCRRAQDCQGGVPGRRSGQLGRPTGVATSPRGGDVYVADAGNRRIQRFTADGTPGDGWRLPGPARAGRVSLAVDPRPPHDVLVGDMAHNRVLQYGSDGGLRRTWGWGVASGEPRFEACPNGGRCRVGLPVAAEDGTLGSWPEHLAVDREGVVYGSVSLGSDFEDLRDLRTRIVRFDLSRRPSAGALLMPLDPHDPNDPPTGARLGPMKLSNGATLGLAIDPGSGDLLVPNNPFGTTGLDVVRRPGGVTAAAPARATAIDTLEFLQNVSGAATGTDSGLLYLASGKAVEQFGSSSYRGCWDPDASRDCHGLAVLARADPRAVDAFAFVTTAVGAAIMPGGSATYRFELSRDGARWHPLGRWRQVTGAGYEIVTAPRPPRAQGPAAVRVLVRKKTGAGVVTARSQAVVPTAWP